DSESRFWIESDRIGKQNDEAFLDRYNGDLDVQLIFAGLFSAVSSAFIIQMQGDLQPDATQLTNKLLTLLTPVILPSSSAFNPRSQIIVEQVFAYLSLSLSLLAAFGAVLGKQW
ncbi:hypothetical protein M422DRAFT_133246, partial [Sphaerobolus stellatus SS14]